MATDAQKAWEEKHRRLNPHLHWDWVTQDHVRQLYKLKNSKEGWALMTREEQKQLIMDNVIDCTDEIAEKLLDCSIAAFEYPIKYRANSDGKVASVPSRSKIKSSETDTVLLVIVERFGSTKFQNKDIAPYVKDLSARQIPSRLKKLVDAGKLADLGGTPKTYQLKG